VKNPNVKFTHRLFHALPSLSNSLLGLAGWLYGVNPKPQNGLALLYLHGVSVSHLGRFTRLLSGLTQRYTFISSAEVADRLGSGTSEEGCYLHLSFDDGYADNYEVAVVLKKMNIPATFFVASAYIDGDMHRCSPMLREFSKTRAPLNWDQVRTMADWGFEIGSHSISHSNFRKMTDEKARQELIESKARIEEQLNNTVTSFSFPYGRFTDFTSQQIELAQHVGYQHIFTTEAGNYRGEKITEPLLLRNGVEAILNIRSVALIANGLLEKMS
jgi:hypothetical protein